MNGCVATDREKIIAASRKLAKEPRSDSKGPVNWLLSNFIAAVLLAGLVCMTGCTKALEPCAFFSQEPSDAASPIAKTSNEASIEFGEIETFDLGYKDQSFRYRELTIRNDSATTLIMKVRELNGGITLVFGNAQSPVLTADGAPDLSVSLEDIPLRLRALTPPSSTKGSIYSYYLIDESTGVGYLVEHGPYQCRITPILPSAASAAIAD